MPNVQLTETMQDYVERQVKIGAYANVSEVVRAGLRKLMDEDGAGAFYALKADLEAAMAEPDEEVDLDELFGLKGCNFGNPHEGQGPGRSVFDQSMEHR